MRRPEPGPFDLVGQCDSQAHPAVSPVDDIGGYAARHDGTAIGRDRRNHGNADVEPAPDRLATASWILWALTIH